MPGAVIIMFTDASMYRVFYQLQINSHICLVHMLANFKCS